MVAGLLKCYFFFLSGRKRAINCCVDGEVLQGVLVMLLSVVAACACARGECSCPCSYFRSSRALCVECKRRGKLESHLCLRMCRVYFASAAYFAAPVVLERTLTMHYNGNPRFFSGLSWPAL